MERTKISKRENYDFISRLPNPILHNILGLLNTKLAVQTSVLSKRWEHLWTSLTSLNFKWDEYKAYVNRTAESTRFGTFVNTFLLRREPLDLDVFRLSCSRFLPTYAWQVRDWIRYAVNHNTRVLHLDIRGPMPCCIYTCTSLEELYFDHPRIIDSSVPIVNLPNLRKLTIHQSSLDSYKLKKLLSGCTILEFLQLDNCCLFECVIAHKSLKHLVIVNCRFYEETQLVISTPNLLSFFYDDDHNFQSPQSPSNTTLNMPSLTSSCLTTRDYSMMKCLEKMTTFLSFLTNVELLDLHFELGRFLEESAVLPLDLPIFSNLKNLTVALVTFSCFPMVNCVLKNSPNLEKLTLLPKGCLSQGEEGASTNESTNVSSTIAIFPHKKLKVVEVKYWKYNQMIRQLEDTLLDATKEFVNLKICWSKYKRSWQY
ncbi:F-box protein At4g09920-like [Carex rostrata]